MEKVPEWQGVRECMDTSGEQVSVKGTSLQRCSKGSVWALSTQSSLLLSWCFHVRNVVMLVFPYQRWTKGKSDIR